jgi:hypothetical protein
VAPTSAEAATIFTEDFHDGGGSTLAGVGDEAFTAELAPSDGPGGSQTGERDVWVRVANDLFRISFYAYEAVPSSPQYLASHVVSELCPLCKFPTSGP